MSGPLKGLKVIELGTLIAGPYCGRLLAEFGGTPNGAAVSGRKE